MKVMPWHDSRRFHVVNCRIQWKIMVKTSGPHREKARTTARVAGAALMPWTIAPAAVHRRKIGFAPSQFTVEKSIRQVSECVRSDSMPALKSGMRSVEHVSHGVFEPGCAANSVTGLSFLFRRFIAVFMQGGNAGRFRHSW